VTTKYPAEARIAKLAGLLSQEKNEEKRAELRAEMDVQRIDLAIQKATAKLPDMSPEQRVRLVEIYGAHVAEQARALAGGEAA
jgi:hypothetical protein